MEQKPQPQPQIHIGYYLKTLDNLLTEQIDKIHAENGLTRAEWQILNSVAQKPNIDKVVLIDVVKAFTDAQTAQLLLNNLIEKERIVGTNKLMLTNKGKKRHATALKKQKDFREKVSKAISPLQYKQLIQTLDKMIKNLS